MIMDYCEQDVIDGKVQLHIGLQFEDEPDSLYVAELAVADNGDVKAWTLFFNGFDCKYTFRPEEIEALIRYAAEHGITIQAASSR
ncbi:hypothetical protein GCM10008018_51790 [Paenibacillus marchantiophytorum]|uniref:Uncharacterized protein n=1 Tax=Paenibacillus marchantiophytorum TaxID=1619310 RepID=A0ABQ1F469_9BACL|nr:hypothetical protein [Paenibacillus marchantiophytorum]GFZ99222.1 hypothetical protein GCM10008018_51790 [Paenibacillus marchantiophytorum]